MFQKKQCVKCKCKNCVSMYDKDGFESCVFCGSTQNTIQGPITIPQDYYKKKYGYLFENDYVEQENWIDDEEFSIYEWLIQEDEDIS